MQLYPELPIPLPVYEKLEHQDRFREEVEETCAYQQIGPKDAIVPLEFTRSISNYTTPSSWKINILDADVQAANLTASVSMWRKLSRDGRDYFIYDGSAIPGLNLSPGWYYSIIAFPDGVRGYTEVFRVPGEGAFTIANDGDTKFLKIEWWNDSDIRPILYNDLNSATNKPYFRNVCYLDSYVTACEPETTITGDPDGDEEQIRQVEKVVYRYRVTDLVSDSLKKALVLMQIHGHIFITTPGGVRSGEVKNVTVTSTLEVDGARSNIEILFEDSYVITRGCTDNMV